MRRVWILILAGAVLHSVLVQAALAQPEEETGGEYEQGQGMMGGPEGMEAGQRGKHKMGGMMHHMMNKPAMVATSDGGVIVLAGPKLMKYNQNLELVKEVEIKMGKGPAPEDPAKDGSADEKK